MKNNIKQILVFLSKNLLTGFIIVLGGLIALLGVQAFQSLTTTPSTTGNQSLQSPMLTKTAGTFERDTMSLQAISESLGIKKVPKIVFISSVTYNGNLSGLAGADAKCQALADAAGSLASVKGKRWVALIGDNNIPVKARIPFLHSTIVNPLGTVLFTNNTAINYFLRPDFGFPATFNDTGSNTNLINIDENGATQTSKTVRTGSNSNGDTYRYDTSTTNNCANWTYGTNPSSWVYSAGYGSNATTGTTGWLYNTNFYDCSALRNLYCLEI